MSEKIYDAQWFHLLFCSLIIAYGFILFFIAGMGIAFVYPYACSEFLKSFPVVSDVSTPAPEMHSILIESEEAAE